MPLLSICIPTFNRAQYLQRTLAALFSDPDFDQNLIEVIVSDNCSLDNTKEIVASFPLVRYHRNEENVNDVNFSICLGLARGSYLKLLNDTVSFVPGALRYLLRTISFNLEKQENLFFYNNTGRNQDCVRTIRNVDELAREVSFHCTWIANFGAWRQDYSCLTDKNINAPYQFTQVEWTYRMVTNSLVSQIHFGNFFQVAEVPNKGGYNLFDTFVNKYLYVLKLQNVGLQTYEREKFRLFKEFIYPWFIKLFIIRSKSDFDLSNSFKIISCKYWYEPYSYFFLAKFYIHQLKRK